VESQVKEPSASGPGDVAMAAPGGTSTGGAPTAVQPQENAPVLQPAAPRRRRRARSPLGCKVLRRSMWFQRGRTPAIPSSLRSQTASSTPEASGAMPVEAAMSSIEPVNLPEPAAWALLTRPVDPVYPDTAKASGQRG